MRSLAPWGALPLLALPLNSLALGLGEIETRSFLNQPLNARIPLSATAEELQGLSVTLAPIAEFTRQGFDYPAVLQSVEVALGVNASGENVILVTSSRPVSEFFLDLIIQVDHRSGSMIRQYTLLLDPPVFSAAEVAVEPIAAPSSNQPAPAVAQGPVVREQAVQPVQPAQQPAPQSVAPAPVRTPAPAPAPAEGDYTVQGGDTLWGIAERYRPSGVSTNQVMISIFEANRSAFGGNINQLRRGAILRIPPAADFGGIPASAATDEVRRQTEEWEAGIESEPRLVLLPPTEDSTSVDVGGASAALQSEIADLEGELESLEDQLAERDAQLAEVQRLLEVQSAELAELQANIVEPVATDNAIFEDQLNAADDTSEAVDDTLATEDPATEQPVAEAVDDTPAQSAPAAAEPTLVERALDIAMKPVTWFIAAAVLIVLLAFAFLRRRRDDDDEETGTWQALDEDVSGEDEHAQTTQLPSPDVESEMVVVEGGSDATAEEPIPDLDIDDDEDAGQAVTGTVEIEALEGDDDAEAVAATDDSSSLNDLSDDTLSSQTVINLDQADPVAEADFHMAYGLYDQAADLLTQALATDPDNRDLKLKLLEVYFVWGNKDLFLEQAHSFKQKVGSGAGSDWDKVVIMGKQICPDEEIFADAAAISESIDLDFEAGSEEGGIDFTLEDDSDDDIDLSFGDDDDADTMEVTGVTESTEVLTGDDATLDIGAQTQAGLEAALLEDPHDDPTERTDAAIAEEDAPTVEVGAFSEDGDDDETHLGEVTQESPTLNIPADEGETLETPTIEAQIPGEGDTVEQPRPEPIDNPTEMTAELNVDDLGLDVGDIDLSDDDELSATGVTRALDTEGFDVGTDGDTTEIFSVEDGADVDAIGTAATPAQSDDDLDLNLDEFSAALDGDDTVEQPGPSSFGDVDLDIGEDVIADDEPTGTEESTPFDPESMTEVGTKLDLARAYIDMGDPEGARSILEEVLGEGDTDQRNEAQSLIDALPAA